MHYSFGFVLLFLQVIQTPPTPTLCPILLYLAFLFDLVFPLFCLMLHKTCSFLRVGVKGHKIQSKIILEDNNLAFSMGIVAKLLHFFE